MTGLRSRFVARFGDDLAQTIERVADHHTKVLPAPLERGSDPFRFAIVWAIGFECLSRPEFRLEHGITAPWDVLAAFVAAGGSVQDAADLVGIRPSTVKRHLADLLLGPASPRSS